jgi:hypothetical protein
MYGEAEEDAAHGTRHIRRAWRERWTVMCDVHEVRLRPSRLSVVRLLCGAVRHPGWLGELRAPYVLIWKIQSNKRLYRSGP